MNLMFPGKIVTKTSMAKLKNTFNRKIEDLKLIYETEILNTVCEGYIDKILNFNYLIFNRKMVIKFSNIVVNFLCLYSCRNCPTLSF